MKEKNLFEAIMAHLFGHKYYAVIVNRKGTLGCFICDAIYADKESAKAKEQELIFNNWYGKNFKIFLMAQQKVIRKLLRQQEIKMHKEQLAMPAIKIQ